LKHITTILLASIFILTACARAATATATATPLPEDTPAITPIIEGVFLNECRNCHTDKQRLINTARPEEVVEKESSGAG
jgi:uncharacterized lipoprotein YajG